MFRWYVINTYSGHENKVKTNLEHRIVSLNQQPAFRRVVVLIACLITGTYLFLADEIFRRFVQHVLLGG